MSDDPERKPRILIVDDEEAMRVFMMRTLRRQGYETVLAEDGQEAKRLIEETPFDLVVTDIRMPTVDGLTLLRWCKRNHEGTRVIVMTGHGSIANAIEALKAGAENYITKPFDRDEILRAVDNVLVAGRLTAENVVLKKLLGEGRQFEGLVGSSPPMRSLYRRIDEIADKSGAVLVQGESGTGKELVARAVHARSRRREEAFVVFHCAGVPTNLLSAELFGVKKGAFTGASRDRKGAVQRANGGTLFLDEIGDVPLDVQPALLRLLEGGEVSPLGAGTSLTVDVRVVAATHQDLKSLMDAGRFRDDLFYRLNVFPLEVPPLRKRREDTADLIRHFLATQGRDESSLTMEAKSVLEAFDWPGNVRQLENAISRMISFSDNRSMGVELVPDECRRPGEIRQEGDELPLKEAVRGFERQYLIRLLAATGGNVSEAARRAKVSRPTLHTKITAHGLDPDTYR